MNNTVKIFISYSHKDAAYLADDSLLGFLKGLQRDGVEFWDDRKIGPGEVWDEVIEQELAASRIALVLVSQAFLDSDYCQNVEIKHLLAHKAHLFPIILSPCDWRRHDWLAKRQFVPSGDQTVVEHYVDAGSRERLFLNIREALLERIEKIRSIGVELSQPDAMKLSTPEPVYSGKQKVQFCQRLGNDWRDLADYLDIPLHEQAYFERGDEARRIWGWLSNRKRLAILPQALVDLGREDLTNGLMK